MINDTFDNSKPLITPKDAYDSHGIKKIEKKTNTCIVCFFKGLKDEILNKYEHEVVAFSGTANGIINVYYLKDLNVLFYMSPVCAPAAVATLEEIAYITDAKNFIVFGSCGLLVDAAKDKLIIPIKAYRDEGTSYHYKEASEFIDIKNCDVIEKVCIDNNIEYIKGFTWTTDAIYMETKNKINDRRDKGCLCVEMEVSALEAICDFRGYNLYSYLFSGDILADEWDRADLGKEAEHKKQLSSFDVAIMLLKELK